MKIKIIVPVLLPLIFLFNYNLSTAQQKQGTITSKQDAENFLLSSSKSNVSDLSSVTENSKKNLSSLSENKNEKSPVLAGLFSAVLPGAGEFYSKSYVKAAVFLAVEAGMWLGYKTLQNKGDDQTVFFQSEADAHWSVRNYATWLHNLNLAESGNINPQDPDLEHLRSTINTLEAAHFSHTLPPYGVQQYYELIGKYHSFVAGWDDAQANASQYNVNNYINWTTPMFESYAIDRQQANTYYDRSETFIYGVIVNHLLSIADAVWSVSMFNKKLQFDTKFQMSRQFSPALNKFEFIPTTKLAITF
ncbi:hypothetical protein BH10BAC5_BH10BAC5_25150 [soil metagenome]